MSDALDLTRMSYETAARSGLRFFMCRHTSRPDRALVDVAASHDLDLAFQQKHGVQWLSYFLDRSGGRSFCLSAAPSKAAVEACHLEAHGQMVPFRVIEVELSLVQAFLGDIAAPGPGQVWDATPFRTVMFAVIANTASLAVKSGDQVARTQLRLMQEIIASTVQRSHGTLVRVEVGAVLASFTSASKAVECALRIQHELSSQAHRNDVGALDVRIGVNAGEPVSETGELFGAAVHIAEEACRKSTTPGAIVATEVVRELCLGKGYAFEECGQIEVPNTGALRLYEVIMPADTAPVPTTLHPDGLTSREIEVLRLLAAGKSNQNIANDLMISLNTVARHVANILDKTGAANRTEAAAYAYRERLT